MLSGNWAASRWPIARYSERHPRKRCGARPKTRKKFPIHPGGFLTNPHSQDLFANATDRIGRSPSTFLDQLGPHFPTDAFDVAAFGPDASAAVRCRAFVRGGRNRSRGKPQFARSAVRVLRIA